MLSCKCEQNLFQISDFLKSAKITHPNTLPILLPYTCTLETWEVRMRKESGYVAEEKEPMKNKEKENVPERERVTMRKCTVCSSSECHSWTQEEIEYSFPAADHLLPCRKRECNPRQSSWGWHTPKPPFWGKQGPARQSDLQSHHQKPSSPCTRLIFYQAQLLESSNGFSTSQAIANDASSEARWRNPSLSGGTTQKGSPYLIQQKQLDWGKALTDPASGVIDPGR